MNKITFPLGPVLALITYALLIRIDSFPPLAAAVAALSIWMAVWWMSEPVPLELTALLPMILLPLIGLYPAKSAMMEACAPYANESVYFFLGGFGLGLAIEKTKLHRIGALFLLRWAGSNAARVVAAFMLCTALLSMWINNTATTMLMLPLGLSVIATTDNPNFAKSILIGIAYAASIGGMGTLVGTAPNIFFAGFLRERGIDIGFWDWMLVAMPIVAVLLVGCWIWMVVILWPLKNLKISVPSEWSEEWKSTQRLDGHQRTTLIVFALAAASWILRTPLLDSIEFIPSDHRVAARRSDRIGGCGVARHPGMAFAHGCGVDRGGHFGDGQQRRDSHDDDPRAHGGSDGHADRPAFASERHGACQQLRFYDAGGNSPEHAGLCPEKIPGQRHVDCWIWFESLGDIDDPTGGTLDHSKGALEVISGYTLTGST